MKNNNLAVDFRNASAIRKKGFEALSKELGAVGTAYFMRQFDTGEGNYTEERADLLPQIPFDEMLEAIREIDNQKQT